MISEQNDLLPFSPLVSQWFSERFKTPTDIQKRAWPIIRSGAHTLITAPTGTGKTLTAFLMAIDKLATGEWEPGGIRVLYVSPLKALNNDIQRNLLEPLAGVTEAFEKAGKKIPQIRVLTRSGDTPQSERQRMVRKPPEILITTPESLNLILSSPRSRQILSGVETLILDEIHAIAENKRGTHLITAVERLVLLCGEFQRIAVSATIKPLERIAQFVGGLSPGTAFIEGSTDSPDRRARDVKIVQSEAEKVIKLDVHYTGIPGLEDGGSDPEDTVWRNIAAEIREKIASNNSTLIFVNSRRLAERITHYINAEDQLIAYAHHGSLSKEIRTVVEKRLKSGDLAAIVATSSLEMGIDIGDLDQVILVETPFSVSSAIQRLGRAGHTVGAPSVGTLFASHGRDILQAAVMKQLVDERDIEEVHPVESPFDVLAQIIISMTGVEEWTLDRLYGVITCSWPYQHLGRQQFDRVIDMLTGKYRRSRVRELKPKIIVDPVENTVRARDGALWSVYSAGGTIPDRGYFSLRIEGSDAVLGELDEEFVWERQLGDTFQLGTQTWKVTNIDHQKVEVVPYTGPLKISPFWKAEPVNRSFHLSSRIGEFLLDWEGISRRPGFENDLGAALGLSTKATEKLVDFLQAQREHTAGYLPHSQQVVVEHTRLPESGPDVEHIFVHTLWGNRVNYPLSLCLKAVMEEEGIFPDIQSDNDCILITLPADNEEPAIRLDALFDSISPDHVEKLLMTKLEGSGFFGARFRENAGRALLLPKAGIKKRTPLWLSRLRAKKLFEVVSGFEDFPITLETWRTCIRDEFDLPALREILQNTRNGLIAIAECKTPYPSPFAAGMVYQNTDNLMYADDTPIGTGPAQNTSAGLLRELVFSPNLRPKIPQAVVEEFTSKLQRTAEGYAPDSKDEIVEWIAERYLVTESEWSNLKSAAVKDGGETIEAEYTDALSRIVALHLPGTDEKLVVALANLPLVSEVFGLSSEQLSAGPVDGCENTGQLFDDIRVVMETMPGGSGQDADDERIVFDEFLAGYLAYFGPITVAELQDRFGTAILNLQESLEVLTESDAIVIDTISENTVEAEVCDAENLERMLGLHRRRAAQPFVTLPQTCIQPFLAHWQGAMDPGTSQEDVVRSIEVLMGWPGRAEAWEEDILPTRVEGYRRAWLDEAIRDEGIRFFGTGTRDIAFRYEGDEELFVGEPDLENIEKMRSLLPAQTGRFGFWDIKNHSGLNSEDLTAKLWDLFFAGVLGIDSFEALRKGVDGKFKAEHAGNAQEATAKARTRRGSYRQWARTRPVDGHWFSFDHSSEVLDALDKEELNRERVRQVLQRYGVVYRDLLFRELPAFRWKNLFRTLRIMELGGEVLAGHFFQGISGIQFTSPAAFRVLKEGMDDSRIYWLNAADPASLSGYPDPSLRNGYPDRLRSNWIVFRGGEPVLIVRRNGRELTINVEPEDPGIPEMLGVFRMLLSRDWHSMNSIKVELVNDKPPSESLYRHHLLNYGFREEYKGFTLWAM